MLAIGTYTLISCLCQRIGTGLCARPNPNTRAHEWSDRPIHRLSDVYAIHCLVPIRNQKPDSSAVLALHDSLIAGSRRRFANSRPFRPLSLTRLLSCFIFFVSEFLFKLVLLFVILVFFVLLI